MIGAIIQAIDHAMERTQKGMSAGIDVADSQHGGAAGSATTSNEQFDTSKTGENIKSVTSGAAKQELGAKIGGSAGSGASEGAAPAGAGAGSGAGAAAGVGAGAGAGAGAGVLPSGGADAAGAAGAAGGGALPEGAAGAAGSILSDEKAKESKNVSAKTAAENTVSGWRKARNYGANASKGFANAGAIATGKNKQYDLPNIIDFDEDVTKDFKADSTNIKKSNKQGK